MSEYYILKAGDDNRLAELYGPVDAMGKPFPDFERIGPGAHATCQCVDRRTILADCVYCVTNLFISQRALEVFRNFLMPEGTAFLPTDVYASNGILLGRVVSVMIPQFVKAVDLTASRFKELTKGIPYYFTAPPVLKAEELAGLDLVFSFHVHYICSGRLRRAIEKEDLTNFAFEPVIVK